MKHTLYRRLLFLATFLLITICQYAQQFDSLLCTKVFSTFQKAIDRQPEKVYIHTDEPYHSEGITDKGIPCHYEFLLRR